MCIGFDIFETLTFHENINVKETRLYVYIHSFIIIFFLSFPSFSFFGMAQYELVRRRRNAVETDKDVMRSLWAWLMWAKLEHVQSKKKT